MNDRKKGVQSPETMASEISFVRSRGQRFWQLKWEKRVDMRVIMRKEMQGLKSELVCEGNERRFGYL